MKDPAPEEIHEAAEAAASVRFQPNAEPELCPACFHPQHYGGMCSECLCVKYRRRTGEDPAEDPQAVEEPVDELPKKARHRGRRRVTRAVVLSRLKVARWRR